MRSIFGKCSPVAVALLLLFSTASADVIADANGNPTALDIRTDSQNWAGLGGFQFLKVSQSARAVAMGDAYTAAATDINTIFYNPAGLTAIEGVAWTTNYTKWLVDSHFYSAAVAAKLGGELEGVLGMSVVAFQAPRIVETTIYQPNGTGNNVDAGDLSVGLVYAMRLTDRFSFSTRVNWVRQKLHTSTVSSVVVDLGTLYYTGFRSLRVAMALRNFGPDQKLLSNPFFLPLSYHVGLAGETYGEVGDPAYVTLSVESVFASDYELRAHMGAELWLQNTIALRAGYKANYDTDSFTLGAGVKYDIAEGRGITLDVAYADMGKYFDAPLRVSLGGSF